MNKKMRANSVAGFIILCILFFSPGRGALAWQRLDDGLFLGEFEPKKKSEICNHPIVVLKISSKVYSFKLLSATEQEIKPLPARQWCNRFGLLAGTNASMYQDAQPLKSTGYMRNYNHLNNSWFNPAYGAFMVFNPSDSSLPEVQIIDSRLNKNWKDLIGQYSTVIQNYRMISHGEKVDWSEPGKAYGTACIAIDEDDHVLFILSRSPFSTHDFIHILLSLPLRIKDAMYTEGGSDASLYLKLRDQEFELVGTCESDLVGGMSNPLGRPIPNLLGIHKRKGTAVP